MKKTAIFFLIIITFAIWGCKMDKAVPVLGTGTIIFTANGEDFVRRGFFEKNG